MKKELIGKITLVFSIVCLLSTNIRLRCVAIMGLSVSIIILPYFDNFCNLLKTKFSNERKIALGIGSFFIPVLINELFEYSANHTFCLILLFWVFMFLLNYATSYDEELNDQTNKEENDKKHEKNTDNNGFIKKIEIDNIDELFKKEDNNIKYVIPKISILKNKKENILLSEEEIKHNKEKIAEIFKSFNIKTSVTNVNVGYKVTQYETDLKNNKKIEEIKNLNKELSYGLKTNKIEIFTSSNGNICIEVDNKKKNDVSLKKLLNNLVNENKNINNNNLNIPLGVDRYGNDVIISEKNLNILIAGTTGYGKTNLINQLIISVLLLYNPEDVSFLIFDPLKAELSLFNDIPNLIDNVITDNKNIISELQKIEKIINKRLEIFKKYNVSSIKKYNNYIKQNTDEKLEKMPYLFVIIDGYEHINNKDVYEFIDKLFVNSNNCGIKFIISTQSPTIINKSLKEKFDSLMAFDLPNEEESNYMIDIDEAISLDEIGKMIFKNNKNNELNKVYVPYVSYDEIVNVVNYIKENNKNYVNNSFKELDTINDPVLKDVIDYSIKVGFISKQIIQREFSVNNMRSKKILKQLKSLGIIDSSNPSGIKKVNYKYKNIKEKNK